MAYCPLCDKKFKSKSGLQGHFRFKHKIESRSGRPATETALTSAIERQIKEGQIRKMQSRDAMMRELEKEKIMDRVKRGVSSEGLKSLSEEISLKGLSGRWYENGE